MKTKTKVNLSVAPGAVLVRRDEAESRSKGGILLPDAAKQASKQGTVIVCGADRVTDNGTTIRTHCYANDRVIFGAYAGVEIDHDGEKYLVLRADEVLCVVGGS